MPVTSPRRRLRSLSTIVIMCLIAAALSVVGGASTAFADGGTATVSGTVTSSVTFAGIAGVKVQINSSDFRYFDAAVTADDGTYTLSSIPAGSYTLVFRAANGSNFVEQCWQNDSCRDGRATYFTLDDGQNRTGTDVALVPGATLTGSVDGAEAPGSGVANVTVSAQSAAGSFSSAQTDASGSYSIIGLAAGDYTVEFQPTQGNYLTQWWNNQPTDATANSLAVAQGATVSHVDAHLAAGATISGSVSSAGSPLTGATVVALGSAAAIGNATTDANGNYTISALTAGSYTVMFEAPQGQNLATQYWKNASTLSAATPVSVTSTDPGAGIDATLAAGASISGTIFAPGTPKVGLASAIVSVYLASGGGPVADIQTDDQGRYTVVGLPAGRYTVGINPAFGDNAAAEWWGGSFTQAGAKSLSLTTGKSVTGINQQLIVGSKISGIVVGGASPAPLPNVDVTIWASDQIWGGFDIPPFETTTDASGNYSFPNIGPGKYTLLFSPSDPHFTAQWWNNKSTQAKATRLEVKKNVDVGGIGATLAPTIITPGTPTISGNARVGVTLTAHPGNWKPKTITFSYQWLRDGSTIAGATSATYVPTSADVGDVLAVTVTGTAPAFESEGLSRTVTSASTPPVKRIAG